MRPPSSGRSKRARTSDAPAGDEGTKVPDRTIHRPYIRRRDPVQYGGMTQAASDPKAPPRSAEATRLVLDDIPRDDCLDLLARTGVGRLGVVEGRQPLVVPVNFAYTPEGIVVRTDVGTKFEAGAQHLVALEIDEIDPETHLGWSVLVQGHAFDVTDSLDERSERLRATPAESWAPGPKGRRLLVELSKVTGRRLQIVPSHEGELP